MLVAAVPPIVLAALGYQRRWVTDDAFIDFRVVQHLLAGHGPIFNLGERVEAFTNPLWVAILAAWGLLGGPLEIGSVALGLLLAVGGVVAAQAGAMTLIAILPGARSRHSRFLLPLGAAVVVAIPAAWDFATSGLETGLTFGWLGGSFWLLAKLYASEKRVPTRSGPRAYDGRLPYVVAFVLGLGPLIRPDLAVFSAGFLSALALGYLSDPRRKGRIVGLARLLLLAAFLPAVYQVFRMGYFAALAPNTALAKEAGQAYWAQGWQYTTDFAGTYLLWIPLLLLLGWWAVILRETWRTRNRSAALLLLVPVFSAALHAVYVIRVGGDFMHGRLLLPSVFGALLPLATVALPMPRRQTLASLAYLAATLIVVGWAITCALWLRVPYRGVGRAGIADERTFYVRSAGRSNPITAADYEASLYADQARYLRSFVDPGQTVVAGVAGRMSGIESPRVLLVVEPDTPEERLWPTIPLAPTVPPSVEVVVGVRNVGLTAYDAGPRVHLVDRLGLSDPLAARLELRKRSRPGHEKWLPNAWIIARFADPTTAAANTGSVVAARKALACGELAELRHAVEDTLTWERFVRNVLLAFRMHQLRIPADPIQARDFFCHPD